MSKQWTLWVDEDGDFALGQGSQLQYPFATEDNYIGDGKRGGEPDTLKRFFKHWQKDTDRWDIIDAQNTHHSKSIFHGTLDECWAKYEQLRDYV